MKYLIRKLSWLLMETILKRILSITFEELKPFSQLKDSLTKNILFTQKTIFQKQRQILPLAANQR